MAMAKRRAGKRTTARPTRATTTRTKPETIVDQLGHVVGAGGRRRGVGIADVHQPVAERPPHLDRRGGQADVLERLRVGEQVGALATLDDLHRQPPRRRGERQPADAQRRSDSARRSGHGALGDGDDQPQHGSRGDHQQGGRVDVADGPDDEGTQRGVTPAGTGRRPDRQPDDPSERRPMAAASTTSARRTGRDMARAGRASPAAIAASIERPSRRAAQATPVPAAEHDRADPQAVGHPVGQPDGLGAGVPRPGRPGVGDHLMGHPAGELARIEASRSSRDTAGAD